MPSFNWTPTGDADPARLAEARTQLLSAAQWLARVQRSYANPGADDLGLRWCDDRNVIATRGFASDLGLELSVDDLVMHFTEGGEPTRHEIDFEERSPAHIEAWILIELLHRGVDRDRFSKELPYDTSNLMSGDGVEFSPDAYQLELRELGDWFRNAISAIRSASQAQNGALRISPRDLRVEAIESGRALGFSPGDLETPEPFFYISKPSDAVEGSRPAPDAMLKASDIAAPGAAEQVLAFFAADSASTRH